MTSTSSIRYPFAESVLQDAALQPYVHDCLVRVNEGEHTYTFHMFFKHHCCLRINMSLSEQASLENNLMAIQGDIVVMRIGTRYEYVNMQGQDGILCDWVISR
ncbi:hypothetical protein K439DRAFT_1349393 [Ramaria rubella]|nr:hypothetical protein K439DRAFT_1349393 [Ramaria rubella]